MITAIDSHTPSIERLRATVAEHGRRIEVLRGKCASDAEALGVLDQLAQEPEMHRQHSDYYAYEFFVARRPMGGGGP